jgi:hypothetical protein
LDNPGGCKQDYVNPEVHTANSMPNISSCFALVNLESKDIIPVTNYYKAIKVTKNKKSKSVGVKSLSGSIRRKNGISILYLSK